MTADITDDDQWVQVKMRRRDAELFTEASREALYSRRHRLADACAAALAALPEQPDDDGREAKREQIAMDLWACDWDDPWPGMKDTEATYRYFVYADTVLAPPAASVPQPERPTPDEEWVKLLDSAPGWPVGSVVKVGGWDDGHLLVPPGPDWKGGTWDGTNIRVIVYDKPRWEPAVPPAPEPEPQIMSADEIVAAIEEAQRARAERAAAPQEEERPSRLRLLRPQPGWPTGSEHDIEGWWKYADQDEPDYRHPEIARHPADAGPHLRLLAIDWEPVVPPVTRPAALTSCPYCPHGMVLHDVEELDDERPRCCVEGCDCGAEPPVTQPEPDELVAVTVRRSTVRAWQSGRYTQAQVDEMQEACQRALGEGVTRG